MKTQPIPTNCHAITPYLTVPDAAKLIEFLKKVFDGVESERILRPDGSVIHAQVRIADSLLMIGEPQGEWKPRPSMLYHYIADVDATYQRALEAGAKSVMPPTDMFYGDRSACVKDPGDNDWWIASRREDLTSAQIQDRAAAFFKQKSKSSA